MEALHQQINLHKQIISELQADKERVSVNVISYSACSCQRTKTAEVRRLKRRVKILKTRVRVVKLEADVDRSRILTLHERCSALKEDLCKGKSENFDLKSKVHSYNLDISKMRV